MPIPLKAPLNLNRRKVIGPPSKKGRRTWLFKPSLRWESGDLDMDSPDFQEKAKRYYKRLSDRYPPPMLQAHEQFLQVDGEGIEKYWYGADEWNRADEEGRFDLEESGVPPTKEAVRAALIRRLYQQAQEADVAASMAKYGMAATDELERMRKLRKPDTEWGSLGPDPLAKGRLDEAKRERIRKSLEEKR